MRSPLSGLCVMLGASLVSTNGPAWAQPVLEFETSLESLNLSGGPFPMPLASDPGNALGDSVEGYGFVDSTVTITLSSQRSVNPGPPSPGSACAIRRDVIGDAPGVASAVGLCGAELLHIDPEILDGQTFFVDSFFDVFFDITVTDVDSRPGRDFAGQPDGASMVLQDNGPASMASIYESIFDKDAPNFGLLPPPEADPYIGHFEIEIPLGADINGNGENDKIKFTLASHSVGDENRNFIILPDGTVIDEFDSAAFLEGAVVDESTDPPFLIGAQLPNGLPDPNAFGGPTTATSRLLNPLFATEVDVFPCTRGQITLIRPDGSSEIIDLSGPTTVHVFFEGIAEGDANDDDINPNGLDEVQTEIVAMELTGNSSLGPIVLRHSAALRSIGRIEELVNDNPGLLDVDPFAPGNAESFFDVFFEIEVPGNTLRGASSMNLGAIIDHKPPAPGDAYRFEGNPIPLLDANGLPTGFSVGLTSHEPNPPRSSIHGFKFDDRNGNGMWDGHEDICRADDDGTGTVNKPAQACPLVTDPDPFQIIDGLPPGTTIDAPGRISEFFIIGDEQPGGDLGGTIEEFDAVLSLQMVGTGDLAGFTRSIILPVAAVVHNGPRNPGDPVQSFPTDMFQLQGALFGDPDFDFLQVTGGTSFGLPSPGQTTLTRRPSGDFQVDSFFDVSYQIDFVGAPGGSLDGLSGSTQATVRMASESNATIGDPPVADVEFTLTGTSTSGQSVLRTTRTDERGEFWIEDLPAGDYVLTETLPPCSVPTTPTSVSLSLGECTELVAFPGQAMLPPGDPRFEVVVGETLMFGNQFCNDNDVCTRDTCEDDQCVYTPLRFIPKAEGGCDDGDPCTLDICDRRNGTFTCDNRFLPGNDDDVDTIPNHCDNCIGRFNPSQNDTDQDGFGDACDADKNNDCIVDRRDYLLFIQAFQGSDGCDQNGDGVVGMADLVIFLKLFGKPPGPSGITPQCVPSPM